MDSEKCTKLFKPLARESLVDILEIADDAVVAINLNQYIIFFNHGAERIFGYSSEEVVGKPLEILLPEAIRHVHRKHIRKFSGSGETARQMSERSEIRALHKDGHEFPAEASICHFETEGEQSFAVLLRDISHRKHIEEELQNSVIEKEVLLKEIHHRVKNNLQIISSLFTLQAEQTEDPEFKSVLKESQNRVESMALIHEKLYQSKNLDRVDFKSYLDDLIGEIFRSYQTSTSQVKLRTKVTVNTLSIDEAIPCGLMINELISNALKYAFPKGRIGELTVQFRYEEGEYILDVADNGVGFPENFDWELTKSLGLRLVRILSRQLRAKLQMDPSGGTHFCIRFQPK